MGARSAAPDNMTRPHVRFRQIAERGTPTAHLSSSLLYAASSWAPRHLHRRRQRVEPDHISPGWPWRPRSTAQQGLYGHARAWWETGLLTQGVLGVPQDPFAPRRGPLVSSPDRERGIGDAYTLVPGPLARL